MMSITIKSHSRSSDELDSALKTISERWHGSLAAYLEALARAKKNAEGSDEIRHSSRTPDDYARYTKRR